MKQYLILIRPYGMLFIGFTPVFSAIANGEFGFFKLLILFIIGALTHVFTFVQNDYYDIEIDKKSKYVSSRPLTTGSVTKKAVIIIFTGSFIITLLLAIVFFFTIYSFVMLLLSFLCMTLYNKYSKRFFGMEYTLGLGVFYLGIFGALTVSNSISNLVFLVCAAGFMQWLFSVGVSANLKDVEFDSKLGIRTTPTVFGVHVLKDKLQIPLSFLFYAYFIKITHIILLSLAFFLGYTSIFVYDLPIPLISFVAISIISLYFTMKILSTPISKRDKMLIYIGFQEGPALLLIPVVLMSYLGENITIFWTFLLILLFIFWPVFWFRALFGKKMIPLE